MKISRSDALVKDKQGVRLYEYMTAQEVPDANTCYIECAEGHFEEFLDTQSTFIYYVLEGAGTFYLDGVAVSAIATDVIVIKPNTKLYYLGSMKLLLTVAPSWREQNYRHIRFIDK